MAVQTDAVSLAALVPSPVMVRLERGLSVSPYRDPMGVLARVGMWERETRMLFAHMRQFATMGTPGGALVIQGCPLGLVPPTPSNVDGYQGVAPYVSEASLFLLASQLGTVVAYADEQDGAALRQLCPTRDHAHLLTNQSTQALGWHTENAGMRRPPDFIVLLCVRDDPGQRIATRVVTVDQVQRVYPTKDLASQLWLGLFATERDVEHGGGDGMTVALLSGDTTWPCLRLDTALMRGLTPVASRLLATLCTRLDACATDYVLTPGDALVIDNRHTAHNRQAFTARYDGTDRWLQQCYVWAAPMPGLVTLPAGTP